MTKFLALLVLFVGTMFAQVGVKVVDGAFNERVGASTGSEFVVYLTTVPASPAVVTDGTTTLNSTSKVQLIYCTNATASAITITITDNQGSPVTYATTVSIAANTITGVYASPIGLALRSGMQWSASSGSGLSCQVQGVR